MRASIGSTALGHRLPVRVLRRVHPVDHPVLAARAEQDVAALQALAVEGDHHLVLAPLVQLVGAAVPDPHRPGAVLALRDVAVELEVLERMVLGAHGEVVALGIGRDALRHRPRGERALVLEPQVPVQRPGVVLLHDVALCDLAAAASAGAGSGVASKSRLARYGPSRSPIGSERYRAPRRLGNVPPRWKRTRSCSTTPPATSSSSSSRASTTSTPRRPCASASTRRWAAAAGSSSTSRPPPSWTPRSSARCWTPAAGRSSPRRASSSASATPSSPACSGSSTSPASCPCCR